MTQSLPNMQLYFTLFATVIMTFVAGCRETASISPVERVVSKDDGANALPKDASQSTVPDDLALLQGHWIIVDAQRDGAAYPVEIGGTISIEGRVAVAKTTDGSRTEYEITIDPQRDPKTVDWVTEQDGNRLTLRGLYRIESDTLTNCSPPGFELPRPTEIRTQAGDGRWVFTLKRVSADKVR